MKRSGEALGLIGVLLAAYGLSEPVVLWPAAAACVAVGTGLLLRGIAVADLYAHLLGLRESRHDVTAESVGGAVAATAGVLAWLGVAETLLLSFATIVLGAAMLLRAGADERVNEVVVARSPFRPGDASKPTLLANGGGRVLVGLAVACCGLLTLAGLGGTQTLVLTAEMVLGAVLFFPVRTSLAQPVHVE